MRRMRPLVGLAATGALVVGGANLVGHLESSHISAKTVDRRCDPTLAANKVSRSKVDALPWVVATEKIGELSLSFLRDCTVAASDRFGEVFQTACVDKQTDVIQLDAAEDKHQPRSLQQDIAIEVHRLERELQAAAYCAREIITRLQ